MQPDLPERATILVEVAEGPLGATMALRVATILRMALPVAWALVAAAVDLFLLLTQLAVEVAMPQHMCIVKEE